MHRLQDHQVSILASSELNACGSELSLGLGIVVHVHHFFGPTCLNNHLHTPSRTSLSAQDLWSSKHTAIVSEQNTKEINPPPKGNRVYLARPT